MNASDITALGLSCNGGLRRRKKCSDAAYKDQTFFGGAHPCEPDRRCKAPLHQQGTLFDFNNCRIHPQPAPHCKDKCSHTQ